MPETERHLLLRTALYQSIRHLVGSNAIVSSDQFVYWDPTDPKKCLAPDVAVRVGSSAPPLDCWKVWELGAPHLAVEIVSDEDRSEKHTRIKLGRYQRAGLIEIVRFDPHDETRALRLFDVVSGDLVERDLGAGSPEALRCDTLRLYWTVRVVPELGRVLRLTHDADGQDLVMTAEEAARAELEAAATRIRELEAELTRRR